MKEKIRILILDDEPMIREMLQLNLSARGFAVTTEADGKACLKTAVDFHPHLIVLDLGLPDISGLQVLKQLRQWTEIPVVVLTADDNEAQKVELLDAGANDYLTKPFGLAELLARIRVALRTHKLVEATPVFHSDDLSIDLNLQRVTVDGTLVKLTSTEFQVMRRLVRQPGRTISQKQLLEEIWGPMAAEQSQYLRIYIGQLRKKLEKVPSQPRHILTEPGVGYRIV